MSVIVMLVMHVPMIMLQRLVRVLMSMTLGKMEPDAGGHQQSGNDNRGYKRFPQEQDRGHGTDEGCRSIVGARPRGAQSAQRQYEQHEAKAIVEESEKKRSSHCRQFRNFGTLCNSQREVGCPYRKVP